MEKRKYIVPEIGTLEFAYSLMKADTSAQLPGGAGAPPVRREVF